MSQSHITGSFILYDSIINICIIISAAEKATKVLQEALSEYYSGSYTDSMFTYDTEEYRVDLSDIYVPIQWVTREKSTKGVTEKKLTNYHDILHKVSLFL